ncbi:MAG: hypothetical protein ABJ327_26200 [Litoreibacter sp.]
MLSPRQTILISTIMLAPTLSFAAGMDEDTPPKTTQTSTQCTATQLFDEKTKTCVDAQDSHLDDDTRYNAVRELAYAGQYDRAQEILATMSDQSDSRVWTYKGFIARKTGDLDQAMTYYYAALEVDADNILARSYMGQGLVSIGKLDAAQIQLSEIRARGGRGTWAEYALNSALKSGKTFSY